MTMDESDKISARNWLLGISVIMILASLVISFTSAREIADQTKEKYKIIANDSNGRTTVQDEKIVESQMFQSSVIPLLLSAIALVMISISIGKKTD